MNEFTDFERLVDQTTTKFEEPEGIIHDMLKDSQHIVDQCMVHE